MVRALALDLGTRRIGVAVCDTAGTLATPYDTVHRSGDAGSDRRALAALVAEAGAEAVVVGLPRSLDGGEGPAAAGARAEAATLAAELGVPVTLWDERLTTVEAERSLATAGVRGRRRRAVVDQVAAAVILQSWLDAGSPLEPVRGAGPAGGVAGDAGGGAAAAAGAADSLEGL